MARKTILVCDNCGAEVGEGKGAALRITYTDARRGAKAGDLCDNCAGAMPGAVLPHGGAAGPSPPHSDFSNTSKARPARDGRGVELRPGI